MSEPKKNPRRPTYTAEEQREADDLSARIDASDMTAYPILTRLAVMVVNAGRWSR